MALTRIDPAMTTGLVKTTDKAGADSGGTSGQVVQLTSSNKVATGYLDTGTTNGKVVLAGGSDKIATSLIDTGTTDGKVVLMTTGDKLPAVNGSLLTPIIEALPVGMPLQTQATLLTAVPQDALDVSDGDFLKKLITGLAQSITPVRASSKFKIDVTWTGSITNAYATNRDVGLYLEQEVDTAAAPGTITYLQATTAGDRPSWIAPLSAASPTTSTGAVDDLLLWCNFTYIATPTYDLTEILAFRVGARIEGGHTSKTISTNRTVTDSDDTDHPRGVSSITVTEIRGA